MAYTNVNLTVRAVDAAVVEQLLEGCWDGKNEYGALVEYEFHELKYVDLGIEAELKAKRMPFDLQWSPGDEWEAGSEHYRVDFAGDYGNLVFGPEGIGKVDLADLKAARAENRVDSFIDEMHKTVGVISWEDQEKILAGITVFVRDSEADQVEQLLADNGIAFDQKVEDDAKGVGFVLRGQQCTQIDDIEGLLTTVFAYDVVGDVDALLAGLGQSEEQCEDRPDRIELGDGVAICYDENGEIRIEDNGALIVCDHTGAGGATKISIYADVGNNAAKEVVDFSAFSKTSPLADLETEKVLNVCMPDLVGDYDVPEDVPEWGWIEKHASYRHQDNGDCGVWDFILNLCMLEFMDDVPEVLQAILTQAEEQGYSYVLFHQGT